MADPRTVQYEGIDAGYATYTADGSTITFDPTQPGGSAAVGKAVTLSGAKTVALTADADHIEGRLVLVERDLACTVQFEGYTNLPAGASATVTPGTRLVGALGPSSARGYVRNAVSTVAAEILKDGPTVIDASDTTKVIVRFD